MAHQVYRNPYMFTMSDASARALVASASDFLFIPINNYLDLLVVTALRFIQGKVPESFPSEFISQNAIVQAASAEFLQYLLLKIIDPRKGNEIAALIQDPVLQNLAEAVSSGNLVLQVHLLGLLRAIVLLDSYNENPATSDTYSIRNSPMLLQTLVVGLLQPASKNVRFYWLEFITSCLPYLKTILSLIVTPISKCICSIIQGDSNENIYNSVSARDILILLKSLHILVTYCIQEATTKQSSSALTSTTTTSTLIGMKLLTDFVKDVFHQDTEAPVPSKDAKDTLLLEFPSILHSLIKVWGTPQGNSSVKASASMIAVVVSTMLHIEVTIPQTPQTLPFSQEGEIHNKYAIQDQILHILEPLMAHYPAAILASMMSLVCLDVDPSMSQLLLSQILMRDVLLELLSTLEGATPELVVAAGASVLTTIYSKSQKMPRPSSKVGEDSTPR